MTARGGGVADSIFCRDGFKENGSDSPKAWENAWDSTSLETVRKVEAED